MNRRASVRSVTTPTRARPCRAASGPVQGPPRVKPPPPERGRNDWRTAPKRDTVLRLGEVRDPAPRNVAMKRRGHGVRTTDSSHPGAAGDGARRHLPARGRAGAGFAHGAGRPDTGLLRAPRAAVEVS